MIESLLSILYFFTIRALLLIKPVALKYDFYSQCFTDLPATQNGLF